MGLTRIRAEQISDIDYKQAVRVVTIANVTLTGGAPSSVDGVNLSANDRILVTGQELGAQNGIYRVQTLGTGSNGTWARTSDANADGELEAGMLVMVTEGEIYKDTLWKLITNGPISIGTTPLTFELNTGFGFGNIYANGVGLVASVQSDVLTLAAGGNMIITGNLETKTITFESLGGGGGITDFTNITSNVIPAENLTYSLGNATNQWANIYVGGNTIFLGNLQLKDSGSNTFGVFASDGTTPATISGTVANATYADTANVAYNVDAANISGTIANATYADTANVAYNVSGANVSGTVANATYASSAGTAVTVTSNAQPNITSVGTLSGLSVTGNITGGNLLTGGQIVATGNVTGEYILGNGSQLVGIDTGAVLTVSDTAPLSPSQGDFWISTTTGKQLIYFTSGGNSQWAEMEADQSFSYIGGTGGGVVTFSGGTTGLTPAADTAGAVTLGGTLAITNGGTGATTAPGARTNLGLGTIATLNTVSLTANVSGTLPVGNGGTGATTAPNARTNLGLGNIATLETVSLTANVSGTLPVGNGGTGVTSTPTNGQLLIGNGTGYAVSTLTAGNGISVTNGAGTITIDATGVSTFSGGTTGLTPATATTGNITLSGTLAIANGGTGANTATSALTAMQYQGSGTGAVARTATAKMTDIVGLSDYGNLTQAFTAAVRAPIVDPTSGKIWFNQTADPVFGEAANALGRTLAFDNRGATMVVGDSKNYNYVGIRNAGNNNIYTIGSGSLVAGYTFYMTSSASSNAASNMYGVIGVVQTSGAGTTKAIYGRAVQAVGSTGVAMAGVFAVNTANNGGQAFGIQMSMDTSTNGGEVDAYIWMSTNTASPASAIYGILGDSGLSVSGAFIQYAAVGAGAFLNLQNSAQTRNIFRIESNGCATFNNGTASTKMIDLQNGGQINFTGTAAATSLPATPAQFVTVLVNGSSYKIPVYNP